MASQDPGRRAEGRDRAGSGHSSTEAASVASPPMTAAWSKVPPPAAASGIGSSAGVTATATALAAAQLPQQVLESANSSGAAFLSAIATLQATHHRFEMDRLAWTQEKAELTTEVVQLKSKLENMESLQQLLLRRVKMLEFALKQERGGVKPVGAGPGQRDSLPRRTGHMKSFSSTTLPVSRVVDANSFSGSAGAATAESGSSERPSRNVVRQFLSQLGHQPHAGTAAAAAPASDASSKRSTASSVATSASAPSGATLRLSPVRGADDDSQPPTISAGVVAPTAVAAPGVGAAAPSAASTSEGVRSHSAGHSHGHGHGHAAAHGVPHGHGHGHGPSHGHANASTIPQVSDGHSHGIAGRLSSAAAHGAYAHVGGHAHAPLRVDSELGYGGATLAPIPELPTPHEGAPTPEMPDPDPGVIDWASRAAVKSPLRTDSSPSGFSSLAASGASPGTNAASVASGTSGLSESDGSAASASAVAGMRKAGVRSRSGAKAAGAGSKLASGAAGAGPLSGARHAVVGGAGKKGAVPKSWKLKVSLRSHADCVRFVLCHPSRYLVASAGDDCTVKLWHLQALLADKNPATPKKPVVLEPIRTLRGHVGPVLCGAILTGLVPTKVMSAGLAYVLFAVLKDVCVVCISTYLVNFALFYFALQSRHSVQYRAANDRKQK